MTTTDARTEVGRLAESGGWLHRDLDRVDVYQRSGNRIRAVWTVPDKLSGATLYQDDIMTTYTREVSTLNGWLKR